MNTIIKNIIGPLLVVTLLPFLVAGCEEPDLEWYITIGKGTKKQQVLYEGTDRREVKICLDKKGGSGYPTTVVADYDDKRYGGLLVGQCMYFTGNRVVVRFGTPSTGKFARGTYEIITTKS